MTRKKMGACCLVCKCRCSIAWLTLGPCPCPREIDSTLTLRESAYLSRPDMGSEPGDSTKMRGVKHVLSW